MFLKSPFLKSPLSLRFAGRFHRFGVNGKLKRREISSFSPNTYLCVIIHGGSGGSSGGRSLTLEMATIHLTPPEPFTFKTSDDWPCWGRRFEQFRIASSLFDASTVKSESVLMFTNATEEEGKDYDLVMGKFDSFFKVC